MRLTDSLSPQGLCADQAKVTGYHRFQQADFSATVLSELGRLLETRSELLHQKVVLHAYTALLSRLQVESYLHRLLTGERKRTCVLRNVLHVLSHLTTHTLLMLI